MFSPDSSHLTPWANERIFNYFDGIPGGGISSLGVPVESSGHRNLLRGSRKTSLGALTARMGTEYWSCKSRNPGWARQVSCSRGLVALSPPVHTVRLWAEDERVGGGQELAARVRLSPSQSLPHPPTEIRTQPSLGEKKSRQSSGFGGWRKVVGVLIRFSHVRLCNPLDCSLPGSSAIGFSSKNTGVGCCALLQGLFWTQGSNLDLLPWR